MDFYSEWVDLSMNLGNIVDKVDTEDKLVENWTRGKRNPELCEELKLLWKLWS